MRPGQAWAWVCVAVLVPSACLGWAPLNDPANWPAAWSHLVLRPPAALHQGPWVFWTTAWLHGSERHLALNLVGLAVLAAMGWHARLAPAWALLLCLAWPLTHLAMLIDPRLSHYMGASGFLHAGVALWLCGVRSAIGRSAFGLILFVLLAKVAWEFLPTLGGGAVVSRAGADLPLAPLAHVCGVFIGLLLAGIHGAQRRDIP